MSSNLINPNCSQPANLKSAEDWADKAITAYEGESNEELVPVIRQIQADALRWAYEQHRFVDGYLIISDKANQLDPKPEGGDKT